MMFFPHNFPEFWQNFVILVPMNINNKKNKNAIILFNFFLYKECYLYVLTFWYLKNFKTFIIHISRNVLSFPKYRDLCMYLSVFIGNMIKKHSKHLFLGMLFCFSIKECFACVLAIWYVRSCKNTSRQVFHKSWFYSNVI